MAKPLPYIWRPRFDETTRRWQLVRVDESGEVFDESGVFYGSRKPAKTDAAVWNEEEGHGRLDPYKRGV